MISSRITTHPTWMGGWGSGGGELRGHVPTEAAKVDAAVVRLPRKHRQQGGGSGDSGSEGNDGSGDSGSDEGNGGSGVSGGDGGEGGSGDGSSSHSPSPFR